MSVFNEVRLFIPIEWLGIWYIDSDNQCIKQHTAKVAKFYKRAARLTEGILGEMARAMTI